MLSTSNEKIKRFLESERVEQIMQSQLSQFSARMLNCFQLVFEKFERQDKLLETIYQSLTNVLDICADENDENRADDGNVTDDIIEEHQLVDVFEMTDAVVDDYGNHNLENGEVEPEPEYIFQLTESGIEQLEEPVETKPSIENFENSTEFNANTYFLDNGPSDDTDTPSTSAFDERISKSGEKRRPQFYPMALCAFCDMISYKSNLRRHVRVSHEKTMSQVKCPVCNHICKKGWADFKTHAFSEHPMVQFDTIHRVYSKELTAEERRKQKLLRKKSKKGGTSSSRH